MNWAGRSHPLETAAEWGAPIVLAIAAGWAAKLAGMPLGLKVAGAVAALAVGIAAMQMAGNAPNVREPGFEPVGFEPAEDDDVLLLEDRLQDPDADSRVVQLFAPAEPTPGELVLRISDYLSEQGKTAPEEVPVEQRVDASAALHHALANIRANLR